MTGPGDFRFTAGASESAGSTPGGGNTAPGAGCGRWLILVAVVVALAIAARILLH